MVSDEENICCRNLISAFLGQFCCQPEEADLILPMNRIDRPRGHLALGHTVEIGGIAFAGNRGIQKVEVSVDNGVTWHQATLDPALSQDSWVLWSWKWTPLLPGQYTLVARATDGTGEVQTSRKQGTVPNGATGYHTVVVQVG